MTRASLTVDECYDFSNLLEAKYIARADELTPVLVDATGIILAARLNRYLYEQRNRPDENETLRDACVLCEGMLLEDRVRIDKRNHVVVPCFLCRPRAFTAYHAMIARHEESQDVGSASHTAHGLDETLALSSPQKPALSADAPATLRTGERLPAIVAWDLTLRCPVCNTNVEGSRDVYHCFTCARRGR